MSELLAKHLSSAKVTMIIGSIIFIYVFIYADVIFTWIENQTLGTRSFLLKEFELLFIKVDPQHITYALLSLSGFLGASTLVLFGYLGSWSVGIILSCVMSLVGFKIPRPLVKNMVARRIKKYSEQMVDGLTLLTNGIRAGLSMPQALGMVAEELPNPLSQEFNLVLQQNRIGVPLEECFEALGKRVVTEDNDMFISSINILRETGGNLAETFETIVSVIRERIRLQQKIDTYVSQGMFQGVTIFCMPFAIGAIYAGSDPKTMSLMLTHPVGWVILAIALLLDCLGGFIILKIVQIKV